MRLLMINLLATVTLLFGAVSASALDFSFSTGYAGQILTTSDTLTVDVVFNADQTGIRLFSLAIVFDETILRYESSLSSANGQGTFGFAYMLYAPSGGRGIPVTYLVPSQQPPAHFPLTNLGQVNVNWQELNVTDTFDTAVTGVGIQAAQLVFRVLSAPNNPTAIAMSMSAPGTVFSVGQPDGSGLDIKGTIGLSGPIVVNTPEPTTALLVGLGLIGLGVAGRRRA
jgi:hypothetical protein